MDSRRQNIAIIFLALFCMIQLAELHVFGHDADEDNCALCIISLESTDSDFIPIDITQVPEEIIVPANLVRSNYMNNYFASSFDYSLPNKAPPSV